MYYDDRLAVTELGKTADSLAQITDEDVTSDDSTVLTYVFRCSDVVADFVDGYGAKLTSDRCSRA